MSTQFDSTNDLRLWSVEKRIESLTTQLNNLATQVAGLAQQVAQQWGATYQPQTSGGATYPAITSSGGIPAASGSTPGSATVTLYQLSGISATSLNTVTCYSWFTNVVGAGGKNIMVSRDASGNYWVMAEDC